MTEPKPFFKHLIDRALGRQSGPAPGPGPNEGPLSPGITSALSVAEHMLWLRKDIPTTPIEIFKLVYLCHGYVLGFTKKVLVNEAWIAGPYGPVMGLLDMHYESYGVSAIYPVGKVRFEDRSERWDAEVGAIIQGVKNVHRRFSEAQLGLMLRDKNGPWAVTLEQEGPNAPIPTSRILKYYQELTNQAQQNLQHAQDTLSEAEQAVNAGQ